jgi:predicted ATPase
MRLSSIALRNYKGIRALEVTGLETESTVAISGRNGSGKSLVLEAVATAWNDRLLSPADLVGPWGDEGAIVVEAVLTPDEYAAIWEFLGGTPNGNDLVVRTERGFRKNGARVNPHDSHHMEALRSEVFRRQHPFATIDFLPAVRFVPSAQSATIDPELFGERRLQQERLSSLDNYLRSRGITQFPGIKSFLATLHYLDILSEHQGHPTHGFSEVTGAFLEATGKQIEVPAVDVEAGVAIRVTTRSGVQHDLDELSSGEQEALALMYFIRRINSRGGVLLVDEPELHLHPSLQASFITTAMRLSPRAQLIMVTHSAKLLSLAPTDALLRVKDVTESGGNQLERVSEWPGRETLLSDIGLTAVDLVQHDFVLVIEGESDASWLTGLAPVVMSRASVVRAGGQHAVETMRDLLEEADQVLPWICVRDRDFLTDDERAQRNEKRGLFVIERRDVENLVIDATLLARTFTRAGRTSSVVEVGEWLERVAESQKDEVLEHLLERRLASDIPLGKAQAGDRWTVFTDRYSQMGATNAERARRFPAIFEEERSVMDASWAERWQTLVDGKVILKMICRDSPFHAVADLSAAVQQTFRDEPESRPGPLAELVEVLEEVAGQ